MQVVSRVVCQLLGRPARLRRLGAAAAAARDAKVHFHPDAPLSARRRRPDQTGAHGVTALAKLRTHTHTHALTHTHTHELTHVHARLFARTHALAGTHARTYSHARTHARTRTHSHAHARTRARMHEFARRRTLKHARAELTCTHTYAQVDEHIRQGHTLKQPECASESEAWRAFTRVQIAGPHGCFGFPPL
eukprot:6096469-Pleurochrysis_carterae.AAC.1